MAIAAWATRLALAAGQFDLVAHVRGIVPRESFESELKKLPRKLLPA